MKRLESLDILRGFDLFVLTAFGPLLYAFSDTGSYEWLAPVLKQCDHVAWDGFAAWDLIMPLFMFMAGVSIPFAFAKYREQHRSNGQIYWRIFKRFLILWVLGMICQGNLLDLDVHAIKLYSNTLQSIAVGYVVAAILFLNTKPCTQIAIAVFLLIAYWALMMFVKVDGYGGGDFSQDGNLCEYVDRAVLGRARHYASVDGSGQVIFPAGYRYTWILSSLNFVVTVMTGVFAGMVLRGGKSEKTKMLTLLYAGAAMVAIGWIWDLQMPVIKHIWTSSMVLATSGYSFLLLLLFYYVVDYKGWKKGLEWLKVYGMNSILAYMLVQIDFDSVSGSLVYGLEKYIGGGWYDFVLKACEVLICWLILRCLYKHRIFLRA